MFLTDQKKVNAASVFHNFNIKFFKAFDRWYTISPINDKRHIGCS